MIEVRNCYDKEHYFNEGFIAGSDEKKIKNFPKEIIFSDAEEYSNVGITAG